MIYHNLDNEIAYLINNLNKSKNNVLNTNHIDVEVIKQAQIRIIQNQIEKVPNINLLINSSFNSKEFSTNLFLRILVKFWGLHNDSKYNVHTLVSNYDDYFEIFSKIEADYLINEKIIDIEDVIIDLPKLRDKDKYSMQIKKYNDSYRNIHLNLFSSIYAPIINAFYHNSGKQNNLIYPGNDMINSILGTQTVLCYQLFFETLKSNPLDLSAEHLIYTKHAFLHNFNIPLSVTIADFQDMNDQYLLTEGERKFLLRLSYFSEQYGLNRYLNSIINSISNLPNDYGESLYLRRKVPIQHYIDHNNLSRLNKLLNHLQFVLLPKLTIEICENLITLSSEIITSMISDINVDVSKHIITNNDNDAYHILNLHCCYKITKYLSSQNKKGLQNFKWSYIKK